MQRWGCCFITHRTFPVATLDLLRGGGFIIMHEGIITTVKLDKGFGFIGEPNSPDLFFHINDTIDLEWNEQLQGQRVRFEVTCTPRGLQARAVRAAI